MSAVPQFPAANDPDALETQEWLDALEAVLEREGPERAHYLLERLIDKARRSGAHIPFSPNTAYINTIPPHMEERSPGNVALEERIRSICRWNAMVMVAKREQERRRARRPHRELRLGRHAVRHRPAAFLARAARRARRRPDLLPGPFLAGRLCALAAWKGALSEEQLLNFRREVDGKGVSSYPHPWLMPDYWQFPTVSMGLGPIQAIYMARYLKYLEARGHRADRQPQGVGVLRRRRDGRARVARRDRPRLAREARQPDLRRQLQPAAPRRPGARQRQDHPGAGRRLPRRGLERDQGDLGLVLGSAARARQGRRTCCASWRRRSTANTRTTRRTTARSCASISSASTRRLPSWSRA